MHQDLENWPKFALTLTSLSYFAIKSPGGGWRCFPSINPEPVKPYLWNISCVWYYIRSFKKYQISNQGHLAFLMMSSYFKMVIEVKHFYE